ncbi:hypothetical protein ACFCW2_12890 [Qipengyuania sp. DSG2-2]|uniref:hypothetical protein n=1 Tax=Qipengyuania sp. DGS2-2 TaxID=3349631 RepID=UPI0036D35761
MKKAITLAAAAAFTLTVPSIAAAQEQPAPAPAEAEAPETVAEAETETKLDDTKPICKRFKVTGSRLTTRKVCRTAYGWKRHKEETQDSVAQALSRHAAVGDNQ